jgi:hypothetical protein
VGFLIHDGYQGEKKKKQQIIKVYKDTSYGAKGLL